MNQLNPQIEDNASNNKLGHSFDIYLIVQETDLDFRLKKWFLIFRTLLYPCWQLMFSYLLHSVHEIADHISEKSKVMLIAYLRPYRQRYIPEDFSCCSTSNTKSSRTAATKQETCLKRIKITVIERNKETVITP